MLQRIQTIYLSFVAVIAIVSNAFPVAKLWSETQEITMYFCHLSATPELTEAISLVPVAIFSIIVAVLAIISVFSFKKRPKQMLINKINILFNILWLGVFAYYFYKVKTAYLIGCNVEIGMPVLLPVINIVLLILASRAINKDEKLVKSVDRIR